MNLAQVFFRETILLFDLHFEKTIRVKAAGSRRTDPGSGVIVARDRRQNTSGNRQSPSDLFESILVHVVSSLSIVNTPSSSANRLIPCQRRLVYTRIERLHNRKKSCPPSDEPWGKQRGNTGKIPCFLK